jgi:hypothetical protein
VLFRFYRLMIHNVKKTDILHESNVVFFSKMVVVRET